MDKDIQEKLDRARTLASENVKRAASEIKKGASQAGKRARAARADAGQKIDSARIQASKAVDHANRLITEHPVAATAAAAAAGALAAWLFPKTARKVRSAAPRLLGAARTEAKAPTEETKATAGEAVQLIDKIGEELAGVARTTLENVRVMAAEAAKNAEAEARTGLDAARTIATETAERVGKEARAGLEAAQHVASGAARRVDVAEIESRAQRLIDSATGTASKVVARVRRRAKNQPPAE